jgi:hypothetical protein
MIWLGKYIITLFRDCSNCLVPISVSEGVEVAIEEPNPPSQMTGFSLRDSPKYIQAASILHTLVFGGIYPRDGSAGSMYLITLKGDSHVVLIEVGSKPEPTEPYDPKEWQKIIEKMRQQKSQAVKP